MPFNGAHDFSVPYDLCIDGDGEVWAEAFLARMKARWLLLSCLLPALSKQSLLSFLFLLLAYRCLLIDSYLSTLACRLLLDDSCLPTLACRLLLVDSCLSTLACRLLLGDSCLSTLTCRLLLVDSFLRLFLVCYLLQTRNSLLAMVVIPATCYRLCDNLPCLLTCDNLLLLSSFAA
ncbi:hypothetical protein Tco_1290951 [Tanacetum coccineum]